MVNLIITREITDNLITKLLFDWNNPIEAFPWTTLDTTRMSYQGRSKTNWFNYFKNGAQVQLPPLKLAWVPNNPSHAWTILQYDTLKQQATQKERLVVYYDQVIDHFTNIIMDVYRFSSRESIRRLLSKLFTSGWLVGDKASGLSIEAISLLASIIAAGNEFGINDDTAIQSWESLWMNWRHYNSDSDKAFVLLSNDFCEIMLKQIEQKTPKATLTVSPKTNPTQSSNKDFDVDDSAHSTIYKPKLDGFIKLLAFEVEYPIEGMVGGLNLKFKQLLVGSDQPKDPVVIIYSQDMAYIAELPGGIDYKWTDAIARNSCIATIGSLIIMPGDQTQWVKLPTALVLARADRLHVISNSKNSNRLIEV